jgi:hypothetical protein
MPLNCTAERHIRRALIALGLITFVMGLAFTSAAAAAHADSTPVGPLPAGLVSRTTTSSGQLIAVALPKARNRTGLVWRLARRYDSKVLRQVSEADVGRNVVLVFKVVGRGDTALVLALTRGDKSPVAVKAITQEIHSA